MITKPQIKPPIVPVVTKPMLSPVGRPLPVVAKQTTGQTPALQQQGTVPPSPVMVKSVLRPPSSVL